MASRAVIGGLFSGLLLVGLVGCGSVECLYTVHPLPVVVRPAGETWGLDVAIHLTDAIHLQVVNTSHEPVRIVWDDCAYIDVEGHSHRLVKASASRHRAPGMQPPTSVAPGAHLEETLLPLNDSVSSEDDPLASSRPPKMRTAGGWMDRLLFRRKTVGSFSVGKTISVFLAFEQGTSHKTKTVMATYTISAVNRKRHWW